MGATRLHIPHVLDLHLPLEDNAAVLAVLLGVLAVIFSIARHPVGGKIFKVIPSLVFCYFVPTLLTTFDILPAEAEIYVWIKRIILPGSLVLLILALDLPGIVRLGPKAIIMLLAGTTGVVIGGPVALFIGLRVLHLNLPADTWQGMTALCGSWIGGGANYVALGQIAGASDTMMGLMVIPDVAVASIWMGILLYLSGQEQKIDRLTGADASAIRDLEQRMADFQEKSARLPTLADLLVMLALAFGLSWLCGAVGSQLPELKSEKYGEFISHSAWKYILVTSVAVSLSLTRLRNLEGAGASKLGSVMLYLVVACIGASADFRKIVDAPELLVIAGIWLAIHVGVLLGVAILIRAPLFLVAVGSQANIGGAASAPIVAAAFHPSLAPVGVLLAVAGYVLGTYAGLLCMKILMIVAGAS